MTPGIAGSDQFPGYQIMRELEPLGDVRRFVARDLGLHRLVEIHQLRSAATERAAEFRLRVGMLARLNHPGIAPIHRIGDGDGGFYCVSPHLLEDSLAARLAAGPLTWADAARLANDVLPALVTAHAAGVVGGELDPTTIAWVDGHWITTALGVPRSVPGSRWVAPEEHGGGAFGPTSDVYVAGLVLREGFGSRLRRVGPVLGRATAPVAGDRWPDAASFRAAARHATRRRRWQWPALAVATVAVGYLLAAASLGWWPYRRVPTLVYQVAVVPFAAGLEDPEFTAHDLARIIQFDLEGVPGLRVAGGGWVPKTLGTDSAGQAVAPEVITPQLAQRLRAEHVVHGRVDRQGQAIRVGLTLYDFDGTAHPLPDEFRGSADAILSLGDSLARRVLALIATHGVARYVPRQELQGVPLPALKAFLRGEEAFGRDALARAQASYEDALALDPSFALAEWRLANVLRWRRLPIAPDLAALYARAGPRLGPVDRLLLQALIEPDLTRRFALLDSAIAVDPTDAYARLVSGEELWHRGPLVGRDLTEALDRMGSAVAADSALSQAYDHIIMYYVREGDSRAAWQAFRQKARVTLDPSPGDLDTRKFLRLALYERFVPWLGAVQRAKLRWLPDSLELVGLGRVARLGTPWLDIPATQVRLSAILLAIGPRSDSTRRGSARVGLALGLMAQGKVAAGLAQLDTATLELDTDEMRLQRAEWRMIPPALGLHGWADSDGGASRPWLERMAGDARLGARARWALALGRLGTADTAAFARYVDSLPPPTEPLGALLLALRAGLGSEAGRPFAIADSIRRAINVTTPPDPFAPAALHLLEGARYGRTQAVEADRAWLWYLAAEFEGWPSGPPQGGEVDGVLGMLARRKRAELRLSAGTRAADTAAACAMMRRLGELWHDADSGVAWVARLPGQERACRR